MDDQGATPKHIADIIAQVTSAMSQGRVLVGATNQYIQNPYEANINQGTHGGLKLYLKTIEAKDKDEDRIKTIQSKLKVVVTCMKYLSEHFGWSITTSKINYPTDPGKNMVNIFTSMSSLKLEHVKKQAYQYWGLGYGNF